MFGLEGHKLCLTAFFLSPRFSGKNRLPRGFYDFSVNSICNSQFYNYRNRFEGIEKDKCWSKRSG